MNFCGVVYCAISPNNKKYYGYTLNFNKRKTNHKLSVKTATTYFSNAIRKYDFNNFVWNIIEEHENDDKLLLCKTLGEREKYWIKKDKTNIPEFGYNMTDGGDGGDTLSLHPNIKIIGQKISNKIKGLKRTQTTKDKMSASFIGRKYSKETKEKMQISAKIRANKPEERERLSEMGKLRIGDKNSFYNRQHSEQSKELMRINAKTDGMKGKHHSSESKKIIGDITKNRVKLTCPHCLKLVDPVNYSRWHGEKCKFKYQIYE